MAKDSPWAPLAVPAFRALWLASLTADIGGAMHSVGAGWMMTQLSPSPFVVSMVQVASMLPLFLLLLPGGALADIVDRRKLLIFSESLSLVAALAMAIVAWQDAMTPAILLAITFALGVGASLGIPGFQALVPELVPKDRVPAAAALSSMEINIARAVGPAIAGIVISSAGVAAVFFLNAISFLATIAVLWRWRRAPRSGKLPPEHFFAALRVGWGYAARNSAFLTVLLRSAAFFTFGSALWALLPLVGRQKLGASPYGYSILLSCLGIGAVFAATTLARVRAVLGPNSLVIAGSIVFAAAEATAALSDNFALICAVTVAGGWGWLACLTSLNIAARFSVADWVMARGLAMNQMVLFGTSALGAAIWGQLAQRTSVDTALLSASGALVLASLAGLRFRLNAARLDLEPTHHWPAPNVESSAMSAESAVLVTVEYRVKPGEEEAFVEAMRGLERSRRRNGAYGWRLHRDLEDPQRFIEHFLEASWVDHLRHHERTVPADRAAQEAVAVHLQDGSAPKVNHLAFER